MLSHVKPGRIKLFRSLLDRINTSIFAYGVINNLYRAQYPSISSETKEAVKHHCDCLKAMLVWELIMNLKQSAAPICKASSAS